MKYTPLNAFHGSPQPTQKGLSAQAIERKLIEEFQPAERARTDALRHDDDPHAAAEHLREQVAIRRADECACVRNAVLAVITQADDVTDHLATTVVPVEAERVVQGARLGLDRIEIEHEREDRQAIGAWQHAKTAFDSWRDKSGARLRQTPYPSWAWTSLVLSAAGFGELWGSAQLMDGPDIEGMPSPYALGLLFALASGSWGVLGAWGTSLAADKRDARRRCGIALVAAATVLWTIMAFFSAHLRAALDAGTNGGVPDILASLHQGLLRPFVSPKVLMLLAASALTTAAAWWKWLDHIGRPCGARHEHREFDHADRQLHAAEQARREGVRGEVAGHIAVVGALEHAANQPVEDGRRFEREVKIALIEATECFKAIDRVTRAILVTYASTLRRVRPGVDVRPDVALQEITQEQLGDPRAVHERVERLEEVAERFGEAAAQARGELKQMEVAAIRKIENRYAATRRGAPYSPGTNLTIH